MSAKVAVIYDYHPKEIFATKIGKALKQNPLPGIDVYRYNCRQDKIRNYYWWKPNLNKFRTEINSMGKYKFHVVLHSDTKDVIPKLLIIRYAKENTQAAMEEFSAAYKIVEKVGLSDDDISLQLVVERDALRLLPRRPDLVDFEFNEKEVKTVAQGYKLASLALYLLQHI